MTIPKAERPGWARRAGGALLLFGVSTLFALGIGELMLRAFRPQVFPVIPAQLFTDRADGFRVLTPGFEGTISRAEFNTPVRIGEFGVRGEGPRPRRENTFRILALGDSQTFGFGVLDHETYAVRLEEILTHRYPELDVQVVNAGVPGYGTVDEILWLRDRGGEVDPDLILIQFLSVNDFLINRESPHVAALLGETSPPSAVASGAEVTSAEDKVQRSLSRWMVGSVHALKRRSHLATLTSEVGSYVGMRLGLLGGLDAMWGEDFSVDDADRTRRLLVMLAEEAKSFGVPVVLLYTTGKSHVIAGDGSPLRSASVMAAAAKEADVPWIDMMQELRGRDDRQSLYFVRDGHWTATGHRAVAEVLEERLRELGALPSHESY